MAKCDVCGKGVAFGIKVSHSHRRSNRTWKPNVRKVRAVVNGSVKSMQCLYSLPTQRKGRTCCLITFLDRDSLLFFRAGCFFLLLFITYRNLFSKNKSIFL